MHEDIEMMSKEIEQIRDQILKNTPSKGMIKSPSISPLKKTPSKFSRRGSLKEEEIKKLSLSDKKDGYLEDSE